MSKWNGVDWLGIGLDISYGVRAIFPWLGRVKVGSENFWTRRMVGKFVGGKASSYGTTLFMILYSYNFTTQLLIATQYKGGDSVKKYYKL
jgi:hypothetical protein